MAGLAMNELRAQFDGQRRGWIVQGMNASADPVGALRMMMRRFELASSAPR